ncbi:MAG: RsmD family RNA methyltransferase [Acidobacteriota bacterium]
MRDAGSGAVRIAAGRWKGRRLEVPVGARPTSGRAREALFDILGDRIPGARFLDLHAGSGAVGIEAVSRGALRAVLAERQAGVLARNVDRLGNPPEISVVEADANEAVRRLDRAGERFEIIFSDPPYGAGTVTPPNLAPLAAEGAFLVMQRDSGGVAAEVAGFVHFRERAYGRNVFDFYTRAPTENSRGPVSP